MSIQKVRLVNVSHRLPMPGSPGRYFSEAGERVNVEHPFWRALLSDGSIELAGDDPPPLTTAEPPPLATADPPPLDNRDGAPPARGKPAR